MSQDHPWELDKLIGSLIDAYTLSPNDEEEKCAYMRRTIGNSGWAPDGRAAKLATALEALVDACARAHPSDIPYSVIEQARAVLIDRRT